MFRSISISYEIVTSCNRELMILCVPRFFFLQYLVLRLPGVIFGPRCSVLCSALYLIQLRQMAHVLIGATFLINLVVNTAAHVSGRNYMVREDATVLSGGEVDVSDKSTKSPYDKKRRCCCKVVWYREDLAHKEPKKISCRWEDTIGCLVPKVEISGRHQSQSFSVPDIHYLKYQVDFADFPMLNEKGRKRGKCATGIWGAGGPQDTRKGP